MKTTISFLKSNFDTEETLRRIDETDADYLHVDVMDGKFVTNSNFNVDDLNRILVNSNKPLDVHLMVVEPMEYIEGIKDLKNIKYITVHVEINEGKKRYIDKIHELGFKAGLAINPETDVDMIMPYIRDIEYVIVMGVHPGAGGQKYIPEMSLKLKQLKEIKNTYNLDLEVCVDGGVNASTRNLVNDADVIVLGSAVCLTDDFQKTINEIK